MSKKMMRRSLALGALMAFVITGSAMAAEELKGGALEKTLKGGEYKVTAGDRIAAGLFKTLKDDTVKMLHSICQQIWKTPWWLGQ